MVAKLRFRILKVQVAYLQVGLMKMYEKMREVLEDRRRTIKYVPNIASLFHHLPKDFDRSFKHEA